MEYTSADIEQCMENKGGFFKSLPVKEKEALSENAVISTFKKGELIAREGARPSGLMCLLTGKVKVYREGVGGRDQIIRLVKPHEFIGLPALFAEKVFYANASAIDDCTVLTFDRNQFSKCVKKNPDFALKLMKFFAQEVVNSNTRLVSLTQKHVRGRVAESLIILRNTYGLEDDGVTLKAYIPREDMAALSNMTTSNAIRTLSNFSAEKIISMEGKKIKITDPEQLERISELG
jgi:CRP-like cAMP-binding protein